MEIGIHGRGYATVLFTKEEAKDLHLQLSVGRWKIDPILVRRLMMELDKILAHPLIDEINEDLL